MKFFPATQLLLSAACTLAVSPSTGCGSSPRVITTNETQPLTLPIHNATRTFYVRLPPNYNSSIPHRLIFSFHGAEGSALELTQGLPNPWGDHMYLPYLGLAAQSADDSIPTVIITPDGSRDPLGGPFGWPNECGKDIKFFLAMSDLASSDLCIDENLRFAFGFSYGGAMVNALACALPEGHLRAIGFLSGLLDDRLTWPCVGQGSHKSLGLYAQHAVGDPGVSIEMGRTVRDRFLTNNNCTLEDAPEPAVGSGSHIKTVYEGCTKPVTWMAFDGGANNGHVTVVQDRDANTTWTDKEAWNFVKHFR